MPPTASRVSFVLSLQQGQAQLGPINFITLEVAAPGTPAFGTKTHRWGPLGSGGTNQSVPAFLASPTLSSRSSSGVLYTLRSASTTPCDATCTARACSSLYK